MAKFYTHTKPLQLTKLLDGGIARTLVMQGNSIRAVRFDHNIQLDEGLYDMTIQNKYSTGSATTRSIAGIDGTYKYHARDYETEKGIKYECTPRYSDNREGNRKSHFVHYSSTNAVDGRRQTFQFAYSAAINAVKEILTSDYMIENYGEIIEDGSNLQVRTLRDRFLPTDELTKKVFINPEYDENFKISLLCIITLYYLQKTFCFDQLEIEAYDINCATIIKTMSNSTLMFSDREWEIYLTFLYLLSVGKTFVKDIADPTQWALRDSSQKKFYYNLDFKPVSYQNIAIGDSQLNLRSNLMRIVEDINGILGYNSKLLTMPYSSKNASVELKNIINYYICPSMIHSKAYNDCVKELYNTLYSYNDLEKIQSLEKVVSDISVDNSLIYCLARDIVKELYKTYPIRFGNFIKRCQTELSIPKIALPNEATSPSEYFKTRAQITDGIAYIDRPDYPEPQYVNFGYTLAPYNTNSMFNQMQISPEHFNWNIISQPENTYVLRNSPASFFAKSRTQLLLGVTRNRNSNITGASTYEILVEVINNIITVAFNSNRNDNAITLDSHNLTRILYEYCQRHAHDDGGYAGRAYYMADMLFRDISANPTAYKVTRIVSNDEVTVDIEANLFILHQIPRLIHEAVIEIEPNHAKINSVLPEHLYSASALEMYENLIEASRQLLAFFGENIKKYPQVYCTPNQLIQCQAPDGNYTANLWYNYENTTVFDLGQLNRAKEQIASTDIGFLNVFQDLMKYIGISSKGIANILDCSITAHVERKLVCGSNENGAAVLQEMDIWEPHTIKIKVSIPYAEYLRLKENNNFNANGYTLVLHENNPNINSW